MKCKNCGQKLAEGQVFCPECGENADLSDEKEQSKPVSTAGFIQSVKSDIGNSESINMVKTKVKSMDKGKVKKYGIIAAVVIILLVAVSVLTNIHTCGSCGKTYVGKEYRIQGFFNDYKCCKDCYREYYY